MNCIIICDHKICRCLNANNLHRRHLAVVAVDIDYAVVFVVPFLVLFAGIIVVISVIVLVFQLLVILYEINLEPLKVTAGEGWMIEIICLTPLALLLASPLPPHCAAFTLHVLCLSPCHLITEQPLILHSPLLLTLTFTFYFYSNSLQSPSLPLLFPSGHPCKQHY